MAAHARRALLSYHEAHAREVAALASDTHKGGKRERCGVPRQPQPTPSTPCYEFFTNQRRSVPGEETIEELLTLGEGEGWSPETLEGRHDYIQWLFPLRERGVNFSAPQLTSEDAAAIRKDGEAMANVLRGFRMMLRFFGTQLTLWPDSPRRSAAAAGPTMTAELRRTPDQEEFLWCYANLRRSSHNYLRISRILQFLGEVGLEKLKLAWLRFLLHEVVVPSAPATKDRLRGQPDRRPRILRRLADPDSWDESEDEDDAAVVRAAPLGPCGYSLATFWVETPFDEGDRRALMEEALSLLADPGVAGGGGVDDGGFSVRVGGLPIPPGTLGHRALAPPPPPPAPA